MSATTLTIPETLDALRVPIESVHPYPRNPRRGSTSAIRESLRVHGQYRPIVVNRRTRDVLAGNHTYLAAREEGWHEIAITYVDVDEQTAAKIVVVDNRTNDLALYDDSELVDLLQSLDDLSGTAYVDDDLARLLATLPDVAPADGTDVEPHERYSFDVYERERVIDAAVIALRANGFPYRSLPLHQCMTEINALAATSDAKLLNSNVAYGVADTFNSHRWHAHVGKQRNAIDVFNDDKLLRKAVEHALTYGMAWSSITSVLSLTHGAQAVSNFRPAFALSLLRRYAPERAVVLDTSTGYGGRLVGFFASHCSAYIGVDPAQQTHDANERMSAALCPSDKTVALHCLPAEDVDARELALSCDVAITSPPYFAKERYSDEPTQSWKRYGKADEWRVGFLQPMLALQFAALKPAAMNVVNIADVRIGSDTVPLFDWTLHDARTCGFEIVAVERFPLGHRWGPVGDDVVDEPVIVMRKS